jgi:Kyakuja-Dileera-Zisupton transposase
MLIVLYDIACQWSVNLKWCIANLDYTFLDHWAHVIYLVPKFHLPAHVILCWTHFSFNFTKGVGRTLDGEAPECGWAEVNPLAASTKEMGPRSCCDTLDAHFGDYNWRKFVRMGE